MKVKASRFVSILCLVREKSDRSSLEAVIVVSEHSAAWKYILKISNALFVMLAIVLLDSEFLYRVLLLLQQPVLAVEDIRPTAIENPSIFYSAKRKGCCGLTSG